VPTLRGKCRTGDFIEGPLSGMKGDGLWIFTRNPIDPVSTQVAIETAQALGFDVRELKPVIQRGCLYGNAPTPAPPGPPARAKVGSTPPPPKTYTRMSPANLVKTESGKAPAPAAAAAAAAALPRVTRRVFMDLEQGGVDLGRVIIGL